MESIIKGILDAAREARIRDIKANAVVISDRLYYSELISPFDGRKQPMICGLKVFYDAGLPEDTLFSVVHLNSLAEDEKIKALKAENAELRRQIALIREVLSK